MSKTKATICEIERFAIHDGPGIRTTVFFKGCNLNCVWCANPESKKSEKEFGYKEEECVRCLSCISSCPKSNIEFNKTENRIEIKNQTLCGDCEICVNICPQNALIKFGDSYSPEEILEMILKDKDFYSESGGGATFSGGEPLLQTDFLKEVLILCKKNNINTAIETAGAVDYRLFEKINEYVDLYLFDIKHLENAMHSKYTDTPNIRIKENIVRLHSENKKIIVRIPLIPGFNDSPEYISELFSFVSKLENIKSIHFLPYHELATSKYRWIGSTYSSPFKKYEKQNYEEKINEIQNIGAEICDLKITIGGLE